MKIINKGKRWIKRKALWGVTCFWGMIYPVEERTKKMKEVLNLEEYIIPMALIHLGYYDDEKEATYIVETKIPDGKYFVLGELC